MSSSLPASPLYTLQVGVGYDSNPSYIESGADGSAIYKIQPSLYIGSENHKAYQWTINAGYTLNRAQQKSETLTPPDPGLSEIDVATTNTDTAWGSYTIKTLSNPQAGQSLTLSLADHTDKNSANNGYQLFSAKLAHTQKLSQHNRFNLNYRWQYLSFKDRQASTTDSETRSDSLHSIDGAIWHRWSKRFASQLAAGFEKRFSNSASDEADATTIAITNWYAISREIRVINLLQFKQEEFDALIPYGDELRVDEHSYLSLSLHYPVTNQLKQSLDFSYQRKESNVFGTDYERLALMLNSYLNF